MNFYDGVLPNSEDGSDISKQNQLYVFWNNLFNFTKICSKNIINFVNKQLNTGI